MYKDGPPPPGFVPPPPYSAQGQPMPMENIQPVIVVQTQPQIFGPEPQRMTCPQCQANVMTTVDTEPTSKTHLFALLLCVLGLFFCAPCPYCMDSCLVKKHYCPSCKGYLGEYNN